MKPLTALIYTTTFFVSIMVGAESFSLMLKFWDPFYYHSIRVVTPIVKKGGTFIEELDVQRYRICRVEIDRFLIDKLGNVVLRIREPGGATAIGRNKARNMIPVPSDMIAGTVTLLQNVHSECIDGMHSKQWPIIRFEVVE